MDSAQFCRLRELFHSALEREHGVRTVFLDAACGDDPVLRTRLDALLEHEAGADEVLGSLVADFRPSPPWEDRRLGTLLGHYRLQRVISSGGMGSVYLAEQESPRRLVAVKVIREGIASPLALRRFEQEAEILARLHHPGIAQVHEAGNDGADKTPYFVMEYVEGARNLTQHAMEENLSTRARLELFQDVCAAVGHGHERGVIHCDLKPANILVNSSGQVKVIDFGIARATEVDLVRTTLQTKVGQLLGTPQYMSPEQCDASARNIDARSDVYSLGVVLYELLCESLPYDVASVPVVEALRRVRDQAPTPLGAVLRELRGDVETIVLKALDKERDRRYPTAGDLGRDLERFLSSEPIEARRPSAIYKLRRFARRNRVLVGAGLTLLVVLATAVAVSTLFYVDAVAKDRLTEELSTRYQEVLESVEASSRAGPEAAWPAPLAEARSEHWVAPGRSLMAEWRRRADRGGDVESGDRGTGGSGTVADPFWGIQDAVDAAADGAAIYIAAGTYFENLVIDKNLALIGMGREATFLDGMEEGSVITIGTGLSVRVEGLTLSRGLAPVGGGLHVGGCSELRLADSHVHQNTATGPGGGIYGGVVALENSQVTANNAVGPGGGIYSESVTLISSSVSDNVSAQDGGGIYQRYGTLTLTDSTVAKNTGGNGGGIRNKGGAVTLTDSVVDRNLGRGWGGGLNHSVGTMTLERCAVTLNQAQFHNGGGILSSAESDSPLILTHTTLSGNAAGDDGAGIFSYGTIYLTHCELRQNSAHASGGGLFVSRHKPGKAVLQFCTVAGNSSTAGGGIMAEEEATLILGHTIVAANSGLRGPDCWGVAFSEGYNLIGDTSDCAVRGDETGNLLRVNPRFAGAQLGDYSLHRSSPAVDAGDPTRRPGGRDLAGAPRLQDGNLDLVPVVDLGAHEFTHVRFYYGGDVSPGGWVRLDTVATPGLPLVLFVGTATGEVSLDPYGTLFLGLQSPWTMFPWGTTSDPPVVWMIPPDLPTPLTLYLQELALGDSMTGNLSNLSEMVFR